jgi:hypothetical protein
LLKFTCWQISLLNECRIRDGDRQLFENSIQEAGDPEYLCKQIRMQVASFSRKTGDQPGHISLKQSELGESPPWAAESIIHQLVQFGFRAGNATDDGGGQP